MATTTMSNDPVESTSIYRFTTHASTIPFQISAKQHLFDLAQSSSTTSSSSTKWPISHIAVGALTFHPPTHGYNTNATTNVKEEQIPRILLLQRASTDSMPNLWEIPGGACDAEDESILHSVARELHEEAGVVAKTIGPVVELTSKHADSNGEGEGEGEGYVFWTKSGNFVRKYNFLVELQDNHPQIEVGQGREREVSQSGDEEKSGDDGEHKVKVKTMPVELDPTEHQNYVWATEEDIRAGQCGDVELKFTSREQLEVILTAFETRKRLLN